MEGGGRKRKKKAPAAASVRNGKKARKSVETEGPGAAAAQAETAPPAATTRKKSKRGAKQVPVSPAPEVTEPTPPTNKRKSKRGSTKGFVATLPPVHVKTTPVPSSKKKPKKGAAQAKAAASPGPSTQQPAKNKGKKKNKGKGNGTTGRDFSQVPELIVNEDLVKDEIKDETKEGTTQEHIEADFITVTREPFKNMRKRQYLSHAAQRHNERKEPKEVISDTDLMMKGDLYQEEEEEEEEEEFDEAIDMEEAAMDQDCWELKDEESEDEDEEEDDNDMKEEEEEKEGVQDKVEEVDEVEEKEEEVEEVEDQEQSEVTSDQEARDSASIADAISQIRGQFTQPCSAAEPSQLPADESAAEDPEDKTPSSFIGYESFDAYSNTLLPLVVQFLRVTKQLPGTKDEYDFFQSYPSFLAFTRNQGQRVLQLIGKIFKHHHVYQKWDTSPTATVTGIEEQSEAVVEANDTLLERVDRILDMMRQEKNEDRLDMEQKNSDVAVAAWNTKTASPQTKPIRLLHTRNILRPQMKWTVKPDNTDAPFVPLIREKPNAKVPLPDVFKQLNENGRDDELSSFIKKARGNTEEYPHPYKYEIEAFEPKGWQLDLGLKQEPQVLTTTPLTIVDRPEQLPALLAKLESSREIAVDLEAHSYRSFLGFTCLMQLSTRTEDFIVDTLTLRDQLAVLNKVFTDPAILKVFHGAHNDILWLQRDLGLYMVNMFDTYHACKQLALPRASYSFLLHRYCGVTADKQYQLADWRIRPLPELMVKYAREDTHYLLYVYDCLRYGLLAEGPHALESVYRNSARECLQVFTKPTYSEDSYLDVYHKIRIPLKPQQKECLKQLHGWRDQTARAEDESTAFVLPNHMMLKIAELLPPDQEGILACCNPPPPIVRLHVPELHLIVEKSRHYNPLLDPSNESASPEEGEEYTPGFMDTTHQSVVESLLNVSKRSRRTSEIFYVPKTGPDLDILRHSASEKGPDTFSICSETGSIRHSPSTTSFFESTAADLNEAVRKVREGMAAPFRLFMAKIAELREEEKRKEEEERGRAVYPLPPPGEGAATPPPPVHFSREGEEDEGGNLIVFNPPQKRPSAEDAEERGGLRANSGKKRRKKEVGEFSPFNYEEVSMGSMGREEAVKPRDRGDMLNAGEESRASSIKQRTNMKAGNRSNFQSFLRKKFRR